jgi:hypothetical protein
MINCVKDLYECDCDCHEFKYPTFGLGDRFRTIHVTACCSQCQLCFKYIKPYFFNNHVEEEHFNNKEV